MSKEPFASLLKGDVKGALASGDRKSGANGKLLSIGRTMDVENANWSNTMGAPELITVRRDLDFDAKQCASHQAHGLEIPARRWTAYDPKRFGVKPLPDTMMSFQERAYTSPIWHTGGM